MTATWMTRSAWRLTCLRMSTDRPGRGSSSGESPALGARRARRLSLNRAMASEAKNSSTIGTAIRVIVKGSADGVAVWATTEGAPTTLHCIRGVARLHGPDEVGWGLLRAGELVAFPTETVYGLGADARTDQASAPSVVRGVADPEDVLTAPRRAPW